MSGRYRPLVLGAWMSFLFWPFTHAGGYAHPALLAFMPLVMASGDLSPRWTVRILIWLSTIYGGLSLAWGHWADWRLASGSIDAVRQLLFLPVSDWNQISAALAAPLLMLGGLVGWALFRHVRGTMETWALMVLGSTVIVLDHVFWGLPAEFALALYLTTGIVALLDAHERSLTLHAKPVGTTSLSYLGWGLMVLTPALVGWITPRHAPMNPLGLFHRPPLTRVISSVSLATTGYGPGVTNIGHSLTQSHVPVFIAHTASPYYWQAATYTQFNGKSWSNLRGGLVYQTIASDAPLPLVTPYFAPRVAHETVHASIVSATPEGMMSTLFYTGTPIHFSVTAMVHTVPSQFIAGGVHRYQVSAEVPVYLTGELASAPFATPPRQLSAELQMPHNLSPQVSALARRITASSRGPLEAALAVKRYLARHYRYSLTVPAYSGDVVNQFLLVNKEGYCDQFSTAFIMMMRSLGIPARWVVGYSTGTFNAGQHGWVVRASDAHSWAEIWLSNVGWVPFDPTPGFAAPVVTTHPTGTGHVIPNDATGNRSTKPPVNPALEAHRHHLEAAIRIRKARHHATAPSDFGLGWWSMVLAIAAACVGVISVRRRTAGRTPDGVWMGLQRVSLKKLGSRWHAKSPRQWGHDWVRYFPEDAEVVWPLVRLLESAFYRESPLTLDEEAELGRLWRELKRRGRRLA